MDDAALRAWDRLLDRIDRDGYESLNAREAAWVSVRSLIDRTQGGGLISYFYGTAADHLEECRAALRWIKAPEPRVLQPLRCPVFGPAPNAR